MTAPEGEYAPSTLDWVRNQVEEYEASGGTRANTLRDKDAIVGFLYFGTAPDGITLTPHDPVLDDLILPFG